MKSMVLLFLFIFIGVEARAAEPVILLADDLAAGGADGLPEGLALRGPWQGLYVNEQGSLLATASLTGGAGVNPSVARSEVIVDPPGAEALFAGISVVTPGPVVTVGRFVDLWAEDRSVDFTLGPRRYTVEMRAGDTGLCDAEIVMTTGEHFQRLFPPRGEAVAGCDEPHFRIHWAGDIDRDGRLDLLVTFSPKYSVHPRQLYLSSVAQSEELVTEAAVFVRLSQ